MQNPVKGLSVKKRDGSLQEINISKVKKRLEALCFDLDMNHVHVDRIVEKVVSGIYNEVETKLLDNLAAETCAYMNIFHPHYSLLAARISINNLHKETSESFMETIDKLYHYTDNANRPAPLIAEDVYAIIKANNEKIQDTIDYSRDYSYDFFGFKTLERSYLLKVHGKIVERPQHMLMRVSIGIHKEDLQAAFETYELMSKKMFTHASPTLFNAGTPMPQMSSCFLIDMKDDSISGIYDTLKTSALISKSAGGIGLAIHKIRATNSYIRGTNGNSNGIVPMLRVFNDTARYVDQGGGKRKGAIAIYLEPWHYDLLDFLDLRKNHGKEENRARDLFYALWVPDLFMKRVENDEEWTFMCPCECPGLADVYGEEFEALYMKYEAEGRGRKKMNARSVFMEIVESQIETGTPYMLYKDAANSKSNHKHLGTIKSSNLCTEIMEYTDPNEVAVCNLASISLPKYVKDGKFDYEELMRVTRLITRNMNKVIDNNYYPVPEAKYSNFRHRPIGIGIQGLADTFIKMKIAYEDEEALQVNEKIFECIYYAAVTESVELAKVDGAYETFKGSPSSKGELQFDMWGFKPRNELDWDKVKKDIMEFGLRNSLFIAPMPTASTSQIMGNNESFEPYTSNLYTRRVLAGEFVCINPHLVHDLIEHNIWNQNVRNQLIANNGSVQNIKSIPENIRKLYKTVWEIPQKTIIDLAMSRAPFIDQSQSLNIHIEQPDFSKISSMHFYGWKSGLKTGMYYLRSKPAADAIKFTLDVEALVKESSNLYTESPSKQKPVVEGEGKENKRTNFDKSMDEGVPQKKVKAATVCGEDICYSCGS